MTDTTDTQVGTLSATAGIMSAVVSVVTDTLSLAEAAAHLGVSERTILRRIEKGYLTGWKVAAARGEVWRVQVPETSATPDKAPAAMSATADNIPAGVTDTTDNQASAVPEVVRVLIDEMRQEYRERIAELEDKNERNIAAATHWQARATEAERRAQYAEEQVKLLMAPKDDESAQPERRPWWKRFFS